MYNVIDIEDLNKPAVALCNEGFIADARSAASSRGMPTIRVVSDSIPCECSVAKEIEDGVTGVMGDIIAELTNPLTAEEESPKAKEAEKQARIVFKGDLEEVNRFFYGRGWGDGLPIIPPTEEKVEKMLGGTDLPAEHIVEKLIPRLGKATVEKIAINAVMAGALPTYMPILIAGVQALMDPKSNFGVFGVSTGSWPPFWIINGPIRNDINVNSSTGALSPGNIANATIGRAISFIIQNIGGARTGIEDMGVLGHPGKYTMVIAENEEESPWEPLHVEHGLNKEDSAVTIFFPNCSSQIMPYGTDDKGLLSAVIYNLIPGRRGPFCLVMPPTHARKLASEGWTKKKIAEFISEYARVPAYRHQRYWGGGAITTEEQVAINPMDSMPVLRDPNWIRTLVAGGPGVFIGLFQSGWMPNTEFITKKVELPANWGGLVKKYKNIVPTYIHY